MAPPLHLPAPPLPLTAPLLHLQAPPSHLPAPLLYLTAPPLHLPAPPLPLTAPQLHLPAPPPKQLRRPSSRAAPAAEPPQQPSRPSRPSRRAARAAQQPSRRAARAPPSRPSRPSRPSCPSRLHCPVCVLTFDAEGRAIDFDVWVDDLLLFLQCDRADGLSLFDLTSGASPAPAATEDATVRSQWATRDAAARLAVRRHLPPSERAHFGSYKSAQTLYDAVIARYSTPATAALSRLMLPYLFPDLASFATVADLITHLRTSDARFRAALLLTEKSILAVGASRGDPRTPILRGVPPSPLLPSVASAGAVVEAAGAVEAGAGRQRRRRGGSGGGGGEWRRRRAVGRRTVGVAVAAEVVAAAAGEAAEEVVAHRRGVALVAVSASSSGSSVVRRPSPRSNSVSGTLHVRGVGVLVRAPTSCALATVRVSCGVVHTPPSAASAA
ncbi:unnamed protein product [Closterium sp. NIES-64]|nr:unnamed protein product [Closterium sp. NIES-64]